MDDSFFFSTFLRKHVFLKSGLNDKVMFEVTGRNFTKGKAIEMEDIKFHQVRHSSCSFFFSFSFLLCASVSVCVCVFSFFIFFFFFFSRLFFFFIVIFFHLFFFHCFSVFHFSVYV